MSPRIGAAGIARALRWLRVAVAAAVVAVGAGGAVHAGAQTGDSALIDIVEIEGVIDQTVADFLIERLEVAAADGAEAVVVQLDTPGGLGVSMDEMVDAILNSRVPVAV